MREKLLNFITESKISQTQIAKEFGISKTTLSLWLSGNYTGNNEEMDEKARQYLQMHSARQSLAKAPQISLAMSNTKQILNMVNMTHVTGDILLLYGSAGCGKTTALKYYSQNNNGVIRAEADVTTNSPRSILMLLLEEIGEKPRGATTEMMRLLVAKLRDTNRLIIIDEAQHLTPKSFDGLRALNDKAGVGIVFAGNPSILKRMYGRMEEDFDQVHSRIGYHCSVGNRYSLSDIQALFEGYNMTKDCLSYMQRIAQRKGGLRIMIKQYKLSANIATALNQKLSVAHFEEAGKRMGIGGKQYDR